MAYNKAEEINVPSDLRDDVKATLDALTIVILNTLKSNRSDRFAEAERLTRNAQQILKGVSKRVESFVQKGSLQLAGVGTDTTGINATNTIVTYTPITASTTMGNGFTMSGDIQLTADVEPVTGGRMTHNEYEEGRGLVVGGGGGGYVDTASVRRDKVEIEGTQLQMAAEQSAAAIATSEAQELALVQGLIKEGGPDTQIQEARAAQLLSNMKARAAMTGDANEVVHSDVSRGHTTGSSEQVGDQSESVQHDTLGGESVDETQGESTIVDTAVV